MDDREFDSTVALAELDRASARIAQLEGELERHWQDGFAAGVESMRAERDALKAGWERGREDYAAAQRLLQADNDRLRAGVAQAEVHVGRLVTQLTELREAAEAVKAARDRYRMFGEVFTAAEQRANDQLDTVLAKVTRA